MNAADQDIARAASLPSPPDPFTIVRIDDLVQPPPPPTYWWDGYLPAGEVTLLAAHGGTGKSFIALMLAVCIAKGLPLFGIPTRRGRVAFFSAEDSAQTVRRRLWFACAKLGVDVRSLDGDLRILDASTRDPALFREPGRREVVGETPTYYSLTEYMERERIDVLIVDNASDTYDANENTRAEVRAFVRALAALARRPWQREGGAVLLLAHVDKGTTRGDRGSHTEGYSGSTAWHNSVRSRLFLSRDRDGSLTLEHQKSNHGLLRPTMRLCWPTDGLPQLVEPFAEAEVETSGASETDEVRAQVRWLHEYAERGEPVSPAPNSKGSAASLMKGDSKLPGVLKTALKQKRIPGILREAERAGLVCRGSYTKPNRHLGECWQVTPKGFAFAGIERTAPSAPSAPGDAVDARDAHGAQAAAPAAPSAPIAHRGYGGERAHIRPKVSRRTKPKVSPAESTPAAQSAPAGSASSTTTRTAQPAATNAVRDFKLPAGMEHLLQPAGANTALAEVT